MSTVIAATFILVGGLLCPILVRLSRGGRWLTVTLLVSYSLRVALALMLYLVSAYDVPIFHSIQLPGGFWLFGGDAVGYHANGVRIVEMLRLGPTLPQVMVGDEPSLVSHDDFSYVVAMIYWVFGIHPLYVPLLNAVLWIVIALLGYAMARRIQGEGAGRVAAALVSFWPSAFVWSSQILKDSLTIALLMLVFFLVIRVWEERGRAVLPVALLLGSTLFLLALLRFHVAAMLLLAAVLSCGYVVITGWAWKRLMRALALIGLLGVPVLLSRFVDPFYLVVQARLDVAATTPAGAQPVNGVTPTAKPIEPLRERWIQAVTKSAHSISHTYSLELLDYKRRGYADSVGASNVWADVQFRHGWDMVAFLPRGLALALYAPFPWDWFTPGRDTGALKVFAGVEVLLMVILTPFVLVGIVRAMRSRRMDACLLMIFSVMLIVSLALTVTNVGTLFRYRLQGLIPLFIFVSAFGPSAKQDRVFPTHFV